MYYTTEITTNKVGITTTIRKFNDEFREGWGSYRTWTEVTAGVVRDVKNILSTRFNETTTNYFVTNYFNTVPNFIAQEPVMNDNIIKIEYRF